MSQVNERKSQMMSTEKVGILAVIANEQGSKLVNPSKAAFTGEALLVDRRIKPAFAPAFSLFAVAFVLTNVGNDMVIEANLAGFERIKGAVGIEVSSGNRQAQALHALEGRLQVRFEVEGIMMVARDHAGRSQHVALRIRDRQDVGGFRALSVLVSDTFAAFLRQRMTAIQIQVGQIKVRSNGLNTLFPNPLQAAIGAPFLEVIVDRLPAQLFFSGSFRDGAIGSSLH